MELLVLEKKNALEVFTKDNGSGIDLILDEIKKRTDSFVPDISTVEGRNEIKSLAYEVAKAKTTLDGLGKDLVSDWKTKSKAVDASRKKARDFLDALKVEVRKPLTDFEQKEKDRIADHEAKIEKMLFVTANTDELGTVFSLDELKRRIDFIENIEIGEHWEEFEAKAYRTKNECLEKLNTWIESQEKYEAEQAELERLRKENEEREQKEREDRIAKEAAENAKREAEERAEKIVRDAEEAKQKAIDDAKQAEQDKQDAINEANRKATEESERKEQERIEAEQTEKEISEKKAANKRHQSSVNNKALEDFEKCGFDKETSKRLVETIAKGLIRNVSINY